MKLTLVLHLYRKPLKIWQHRYYKYLWKVGSVQLEPQVYIPKVLHERGVDIIDTESKSFQQEDRPPRDPFVWPDPRMNKFRALTDHPLYHEDFIYVWKDGSWPRSGLAQAQHLCKTLVYRGLPERVRERVGSVGEEAHEVLRRSLLYAHHLDATRDRLPLDIDYIQRHYRPKRQYGIPFERRCCNVMRGMARVCELLAGGAAGYPHTLHRQLLRDYPLTLTYRVQGDAIQIRSHKNQMLYADMGQNQPPLQPFAPPQEVRDSAGTSLPDIFPLRPVAGLYEKNVYRDDLTCFGFDVSKLSHPPYPNTLFLTCDKRWWGPGERVSRALVISFAQCMALAHALYGNEYLESADVLPQPISVKTVVNNGHSADLLCYQLNTLKYADGPDGVKNMAWVDDGYDLFTDINKETNQIESYNAEFLPKLFALFVDR